MIQELIDKEAKDELNKKLQDVRLYLRGDFDPDTSPKRMKEAIATMKRFKMIRTQVDGNEFGDIIDKLIKIEHSLQLQVFITKHTNDFFNRVMAKVEKV